MADPKHGSCKIPELVEVFLFSYRNSYCQALGCSPASKIFSFVPKTDLDSNLKPKQEKVKKRVRFDLRVEEKIIDKRESVNEKPRVRKNDDYAVGDLVWYRCEYKTMRSWLEAVIVGVNSKNTYYIEVSGNTKLASRNQLKRRVVARNDYIYPKVEPNVIVTPKKRYKRRREKSSPLKTPERPAKLRRSKRVRRRSERYEVYRFHKM
uniref:(northern house mosquito) hypothetical protein n=1 Tax=Culex pipiens TaxID=7175 RepID=A0A8D8CLV9_CULPI